MTPKLFTELGLSPESLKAVERLGFEQASPIQAGAIPVLLQGRDVVGQSQTGSGKTAAFGLPAIEKLDPKVRGVQVLVLCPTRELAVQVCEEMIKLAHFHRVAKPLPIFGGTNYDRQYAGLRAGANIVVGTPGRVQDHIERGTLQLDRVKMVVLDEADEMLDMGFREDIEKILQHVPAERQTVLFSATIPRPIEDLIGRYTRNPERVQIAAKALTVPTVEQTYYEVHQQWKADALTRLLDLHDVKLGIVFCNTQRTVDELTEHLHAAGYDAEALHGGMAQVARDRVMKKFKTGSLALLVATDVAGRGLDVNDIEVVFNFDLPYDPEDYVHRIGRTGRAGRSGHAITLVSGREFFRIRHLERFTRQRILRGRIPSQDELAEAKDRKFFEDVRTVMQHADLAPHEHTVQTLLDEGFDSVQIAGALLFLLKGGEIPSVGEAAPERASLWAESGAAKPAGAAPAPAAVEARRETAPPSPPVRPTAPKPAEAVPVRPIPAAPEPKTSPAEVAASEVTPEKVKKRKPRKPSEVESAPVPEPDAMVAPVAVEVAATISPEPAVAMAAPEPSGPQPGVAEPANPEPAPTSPIVVAVEAVPPTETPVVQEAPVTVPELVAPLSSAPTPEPPRGDLSATATVPQTAEVAVPEVVRPAKTSAKRPKAAPQPETALPPAAEPVAPTPAPAVEPPQFRASTWDRPKFAPRFDRSEPADEARPRPEAPVRPPAPRPERSFERRPPERGFERPARPFEPARGQPDEGYDRPPDRHGRFGDPGGLAAGRERPMRYTARPDGAMTQLWISMGEADGVTPRDIVGCILGETGLPGNTVGQVQIAERHTLVEVPKQDAGNILAALNQAQLRGRRLRAKLSEY